MSDEPLDQINRFVIAVTALLVLFGALLVALLAWGAPGESIGRIEDFAGYLRDHENRDGKVIVTLVAAVAAMLALTLMIIEVTPSPTQRMRVRKVGTGDAAITTTEIARRVEEEIAGVADIAAASAIVAARGKKVEVVLELQVEPAADLARTADEACRRAHALIEERMGIALVQRPRARMRYRELRLKEGEAPTPPPTGWERPQSSEGTHD